MACPEKHARTQHIFLRPASFRTMAMKERVKQKMADAEAAELAIIEAKRKQQREVRRSRVADYHCRDRLNSFAF